MCFVIFFIFIFFTSLDFSLVCIVSEVSRKRLFVTSVRGECVPILFLLICSAFSKPQQRVYTILKEKRYAFVKIFDILIFHPVFAVWQNKIRYIYTYRNDNAVFNVLMASNALQWEWSSHGVSVMLEVCALCLSSARFCSTSRLFPHFVLNAADAGLATFGHLFHQIIIGARRRQFLRMDELDFVTVWQNFVS